VASFVPELLNPEDPESVAQWARDVGDVVNGQLSIGEPISHDVALFPNGVKGHMLGSFVTHTAIVLADNAYTFTHNLNIPNKATGGFNVGWIPVRYIHDGNTVDAASTISVNYETGDAITANAIDLRFYFGGTRVIAGHALTATIWFFPTTR
jgi:hypothetical protein